MIFGWGRPRPERRELRITGLHHGACVSQVKAVVERLPGVSAVEVFPLSERLRLRLDPVRTPLEIVAAEVRALGYGMGPLPRGEPLDLTGRAVSA